MVTTKSTIQIEIRAEGDAQRVLFAGPVNEDAKNKLNDLAAKLGSKVILDLGEVTLLNSCGVRDWAHFIRAINKNREISFDRCTDAVVRVMNMVLSFHAHLPVLSLLREYSCPHCGRGQVETLVSGKDYTKGQSACSPVVKCLQCGQTTEPVELDEEYYCFLE